MKFAYLGRSMINLIYTTRMYFETVSKREIHNKADVYIQEEMIDKLSPSWLSYRLLMSLYDRKK
jgi:hypothetical protein